MKDVAGLHEMLQDLYTINPRNIYFVSCSLLLKGLIERENTVLDSAFTCDKGTGGRCDQDARKGDRHEELIRLGQQFKSIRNTHQAQLAGNVKVAS